MQFVLISVFRGFITDFKYSYDKSGSRLGGTCSFTDIYVIYLREN